VKIDPVFPTQPHQAQRTEMLRLTLGNSSPAPPRADFVAHTHRRALPWEGAKLRTLAHAALKVDVAVMPTMRMVGLRERSYSEETRGGLRA
jgi:hypothetical protein